MKQRIINVTFEAGGNVEFIEWPAIVKQLNEKGRAKQRVGMGRPFGLLEAEEQIRQLQSMIYNNGSEAKIYLGNGEQSLESYDVYNPTMLNITFFLVYSVE